MSDEELDSLFRRGAEAFPEDIHPGAWARMEDKLNEAAAAQRLRQQVTGGFATEVGTVLLLLWQGYEFVRPAATQTARPATRAAGPFPAAGPATAGPAAAPGPVAPATAVISALRPFTATTAPTSQPEHLPQPSAAVGGAAAALAAPVAPGPAARVRLPLIATLLAGPQRRRVAANRFNQEAAAQHNVSPDDAQPTRPAGRAQSDDGLAAAQAAPAAVAQLRAPSALAAGGGRGSLEKNFDGFVKYKLLRQSTGAGAVPVSATLLATALSSLKFAPQPERSMASRLTYTYQVLLARKFSPGFSGQLMPTLLHRNFVAARRDQNNVYALGVAARQKLTKRLALSAEYYYLLPGATRDDYRNSIASGSTSKPAATCSSCISPTPRA